MDNISLVIINENAEPYLKLLFSSLEKQGVLGQLDIILVDNDSSDRSVELAKQWGISKVLVSEKVRNKGILYNMGQQRADRKYVIFAHSDIYFSPCFFEKLQLFLWSGNHADFVNFQQVYVDGQVFGNHFLGIDFPNKKVYYRQLFQNLPHGVELFSQCSESCFMVKNNVFESFRFDPDYYDSFFEYAFLTHLWMNKMLTVDFIEAEVYHYFLEMHEKLKTLTMDKELFIKKNNHIFTLHDNRIEINRLQKIENQHYEIIHHMTDQIQHYRSELELMSTKVRELEQELINNGELAVGYSLGLEKDISSQNQIIKNHEAHIQQLLERDRELNNIYHSGGWKLLSRYYRLRDVILPRNSKRFLLAKLTFKMVRNPKLLKNINKHNIKKFLGYRKTDSTSMLQNRIDNYLERHSADRRIEFQIMQDIDTTKPLVFEGHLNPLVSIIIPVYNQWHYTYSCLASILEHTNDVQYEIIIADDVSKDDTIHIKDVVQNIKVVRDEVNRGFLLNCNNAAKHANGKYMLFLNNDTNVQEGWLSSLVDLIETDHQIGMVGSKLVYPDGRLQEAGGIIWSDASGWNYGRLDDPEKSEYNYVKEVDYISGAAIMIRKDLWDVIGCFDERYVPAYYEDSDLAFEVRRHGYKVMYQPKSVVVHFEGISHGTDTGSGVKSYQVANKQKFLNKWKDILQKSHFPNAEHVFLAKDRSSTKKTVVVIDHYVPHYDKDAGGRCVYQYLKLFVDCGYHVIFIGDNFFKHEPYTTHLEQMGIQVLYGNWYAKNIEDWIKQNKAYIDYVYLNRPHISTKYIDVFRKYTNSKIIYFGHDLHYLREMRNYEIDPNPELLKSSEKWKEIEFELFEKADTIYTVGSYEQEVLMKEYPNKTIRNIPLYFYDQDAVDVLKPGFDDRKDLLFVGGFNHKPNLDAVMWFVKEVFPFILQTKPEIKIYIVGSNPPQEIMDLKSKHIIVTGFVSDEELQKYYDKCKIVVVPLRFGAGVKGKVIEALANNVPIVTTSIGAEGLSGIEESVKIANDVNDYITNVIELYDDRLEWERLSGNSRQYIARNFSSYAAKNIILHDFK